jgi:dTDP-4-dehydrorhamnose 3,5-epimerase-like enzyme
MSVKNCKIIDLPKILDPRGNLTVVESSKNIPFEIKRIFYLYDVPGGESRGEHANIYTEQFVIAMSGSFDVVVDDGHQRKKFSLNRAYYGLYIPKMIWRGIENFSSGGVCVALASTLYSADDYIRDYDEFKRKVTA